MKPIEFYKYDNAGYQKLFHFNSWRVAILNYIDELKAENIAYFECHNSTDEAFLLLEGEVVMCLLENDIITGYKLQRDEVCNIKQGTFHTHVLSRDAKLLIIEEESTNYHNSDRIYINESQRQEIINIWERRNEL